MCNITNFFHVAISKIFLVVHADKQVLEILQGTEPTLPADACKSPRQRDSSSAAAMEVSDADWESRLRDESSSLCAAATEVGPPASKSRTRTTQSSSSRKKRASTSAAPRVTKPAHLLRPALSSKEQNPQYEPMEVTDSSPEPLPSRAPTVTEAATALSERSQSPTQAAFPALPEATSAAQKFLEPEPSSMEPNLHKEPCSKRPRRNQHGTKRCEYDCNFRLYNVKVNNYVYNATVLFFSCRSVSRRAASCEATTRDYGYRTNVVHGGKCWNEFCKVLFL